MHTIGYSPVDRIHPFLPHHSHLFRGYFSSPATQTLKFSVKMAQEQEQNATPANGGNKVHWSKLEEVEKAGRPVFFLTKTELKLLGIAGVCTLLPLCLIICSSSSRLGSFLMVSFTLRLSRYFADAGFDQRMISSSLTYVHSFVELQSSANWNVQPVATMLQWRLYNGKHLPPNLEGFMKAGANIGSVIGQFAFGTYCVHMV